MLKLQRNYRAEFEIGERNGLDLIPRDKLTIFLPARIKPRIREYSSLLT